MRAERGTALPSLLLSLSMCLWLGACADGYPGEDVPLISPFDMHKEQRLAALNEIGRGAQRDQRWSFALGASCELQVRHQRKGSPALSEVFALQRSMDARVAFDKAQRTFGVHLVSSADQDAPRVGTLLASPAWTDAVQAELLLRLLIRDCADEV
jgi:hypothetical protein